MNQQINFSPILVNAFMKINDGLNTSDWSALQFPHSASSVIKCFFNSK